MLGGGNGGRLWAMQCCLHGGAPLPTDRQPTAAQVPNGAAGFYLLGRIHQLSNRHSAAIAYYSAALQQDPMLWGAFEELCALGADHEAQQYLAAAAAGGASSRLFSGAAAGPSGQGAAAGGAAPHTAGGGAGMPSPTSFQTAAVATPSAAAQQQQQAGTPSASGGGPAPMSTAATKPSGLGAMFSWMDAGRSRGAPASTARVRGCTGAAQEAAGRHCSRGACTLAWWRGGFERGLRV